MKFSIEVKDEKIHYCCKVGTSEESGTVNLSLENYDLMSRIIREFSNERYSVITSFKDKAISDALRNLKEG
jgi:hypothetical protein